MSIKEIQTLTLSALDNAYSQNVNLSIAFDNGTETTVNIYPTNYGGDYALKTAASIAGLIQNALAALPSIGTGKVVVNGVDNLDDSYTFTITFNSGLGNVPTITMADTARLYNLVGVNEYHQADGALPETESFNINGSAFDVVHVTDAYSLNITITFDENGLISSITGTILDYTMVSGGEGTNFVSYTCYTSGYRNVSKTGGGTLTHNILGSDGVYNERWLVPTVTPVLSGTWKPITNPLVSGNGTIFSYDVDASILQAYFVSCGFDVTITGGPLPVGNFIVIWNVLGPQTTAFNPVSSSVDPSATLNLRGTAITYEIESVQDGMSGMFGYNFNPIMILDDEDVDFTYNAPKTVELEPIEAALDVSIGRPKIVQKECKGKIEGWRYYYPPLAKTPLYNQRKGAWVAANTVHIQNLTGKAKYCKRK
jgi:hypothetical protein